MTITCERGNPFVSKEGIQRKVKREVVRTVLERAQTIDVEKLGAPREEDIVHYENIEEILNIPYMNRDEVPLGMDIFKPTAAEGTELPVIVTIHGGGLALGDRKVSRPFGRLLASKGYLVFSIEYRLAPRANVCMELDDVCAGLDLVGQRLVDYDVDFNRIFIAAESAGAYLAAYVTAMKGSKKLQEAIGYEPSRVSFKAIGLMSGMLYTNKKDPTGWLLSEQIYGDKRADDKFLEYMNPEHPEIIKNLPPAFFVTSKGDVLNNYSILMNEALKKAGKPCHLLYYGSDDLLHAFTAMQTEHPKSIESIGKMLAWFEEQAKISANREKTAKTLAAKKKKVLESMADGSMDNQRIWQYVKERAAADPDRMYAPAIMDCAGTYTYAQMFEQWDRYARVFSALGMTGAKKSRVAIVGTISAEPIFAYYGLNMTGAGVSMFSFPDLLPGGRWKSMVEKEHITDMVISDIMVTPQMWEELKKAKAEFGLKNVILLHTRMGGPTIGYAEMMFNEFNYHALKRVPDIQIMDDLLETYKDAPIKYGKKTGDQIAVICHTSGTSNGTRKPLPFTDRMVNALASAAPSGMPVGLLPGMASSGMSFGSPAGGPPAGIPSGAAGGPPAGIPSGAAGGPPAGIPANAAGGPPAGVSGGIPFDVGRMVLIPPFDFSSSSNINGFVNMSFASGHSIVTTLFGFLHPKFVRCLKYYKVDLVFCSGFMLDQWMQLPELDADAFASLKVIGFGGSYLSPTKLEKYEAFLKAHGFHGVIFQGYGMSETAGALFILPPNCKEDIIGFPDNIENFRLFDETDGKFHKISDRERDGIIYGRSASMCLNMLDGEKLFDLTNIDGLDFVCMNDVVHVNADGSLSYVGRSNQYFVNNEGVKFDSGLVEKQLAAHPNINLCAVVPVLDKRIHDTVPVLYVVPEHKGVNAAEEIKTALVDVFIKSDALKDSVLPTQFVVVDSIPLSASGKIDVYTITRSRLTGSAYNILPDKNGETVVNIRYIKAAQLNSYTGGTLPNDMGKDSSFGIFDIFSTVPGYLKYKQYPKKFAERLRESKEAMRAKIPEFKLKIPGTENMQGLFLDVSKLPAPLATAATLLEVLIQDQAISKNDYEE